MKNENKKERLNSISNGVDKVVIGNWKMNPNTKEEGTVLVKEIEKGIETINEPDIVVAPPFLFLSSVKDNLSKIKLGAQNVYGNSGGAHTGEVSIEELKNIGVEYVIVGHSERRKDGETDEEIARKVKVVINSDLT
ncbi:MAG: triose-phosphate isomerase, partial [Candidatus Paceibacterota bacterium]